MAAIESPRRSVPGNMGLESHPSAREGDLVSTADDGAQKMASLSCTHVNGHSSVRCISIGQRPGNLRVAANARISRSALRKSVVIPASSSEVNAETKEPVTTSAEDEIYELYLPKPVPIRFARGNDGRPYVKLVRPGSGLESQVEAGDMMLAVSASFGDEIWDATSYGQVMYAMKTRNGDIYLKMKKCYGDLSPITDLKDDAYKKERDGGNYGMATKERQEKNYREKKELEKKRRDMFKDGLKLFSEGKYDDAILVFEDIIGLEPRNYIGDNFSRYTQEYQLSHYNAACCYSKTGAIDASLEALNECMLAGFDDFGKIRSDSNLEEVRKSDKFRTLVNRYDEPIINENAMKIIKGIFPFGK